jgi:hypothetical protein
VAILFLLSLYTPHFLTILFFFWANSLLGRLYSSLLTIPCGGSFFLLELLFVAANRVGGCYCFVVLLVGSLKVDEASRATARGVVI